MLQPLMNFFCVRFPTETSAEPSLQAKQLQLKRARLADDLNDKISHRPGPIELVHKNILSVSCPLQHSLLGWYRRSHAGGKASAAVAQRSSSAGSNTTDRLGRVPNSRLTTAGSRSCWRMSPRDVCSYTTRLGVR